MRHLDYSADIGEGLALVDQLPGSFEIADDVLGCLPGAFHGEDSGQVWPDEDSHSPWNGLRGQSYLLPTDKWLFGKTDQPGANCP